MVALTKAVYPIRTHLKLFKPLKKIVMNYSTFAHSNEQYLAVNLPDPLERYGSAHLDQDIFGISVSRSPKSQQMVFVRRVILITASQFFIISIMSFFIVRIPLFQWLKDSVYSWYIVLIPAVVIALVMVWQLLTQYFQLTTTSKTAMLSLYTISMSIVVSNIISKMIYTNGILVMTMSVFGLCCLLLYTLQKKFSFSGSLPFVCSVGAICLSSLWLRLVYDMDPLEIVFPITASSLVCIYIIVELYFIMNNMIAEDYILANIYLFVDFAYPIRFIHHFCELTDSMNTFPDILYPGDV